MLLIQRLQLIYMMLRHLKRSHQWVISITIQILELASHYMVTVRVSLSQKRSCVAVGYRMPSIGAHRSLATHIQPTATRKIGHAVL